MSNNQCFQIVKLFQADHRQLNVLSSDDLFELSQASVELFDEDILLSKLEIQALDQLIINGEIIRLPSFLVHLDDFISFLQLLK